MVKSFIKLDGKQFEDYEELISKLANIINVKNAAIFAGKYECDCETDDYNKGDIPLGYYSEATIKKRLKGQMEALIKEFIYKD